jgi:hypothetical protein
VRAARSVAFLAAALAVVALVAWLLVRGRGGEGEATGGPDALATAPTPSAAPTLGGPERSRPADRPPTRETPEAAFAEERETRGSVRDADGKPVANATVFAVSKDRARDDHEDATAPRATTDSAGRFALRAPVRRRWIGASDGRHMPAFADGDAIPEGADVDLVLSPGREVVVSVRDGGDRPVGDVRVEVSSTSAVARWFPAPDEVGRAHDQGRTCASGEVVLSLGTTNAVVAHVVDGEWVADPVELARPPGRVEIRVLPSCSVRGVVLEAETGEPFGHEYDVRLTGGDGASHAGYVRGTFGADGFRLTGGLRPGSYRAKVLAPGRREWTSPLLTAARPGDEMTVRAELARLDDFGAIVLRLRPPPAVAPAVARWVFPPLALIRPTRGAEGAWKRPDRPPRWKASSGELTIPDLRAGSYDVLAWTGGGEDVCTSALAVGVQGGGDSEVEVDASRGAILEPGEPILESNRAMGAVVRASGVGPLPIVWRGPHGSVAWTTDAVWPWDAKALGPYPFEDVEATIKMRDGTKRSLRMAAR